MNLAEIIASLAECGIFVRLCNGYLGFKSSKLKWLKTLCLFLILSLVDVFLSQLNGFEIISIMLILLFMFTYSVIFLNGKILEKVLVSIIPTTTALPINLIVITAFGALSGNNRSASLVGGEMRIPVLFFTKALLFLACEILIKIKNKRSTNLTGYQWAIQISCFFISFIMSSLLWNISRTYSDTSPLFLTIFLMIAALNILLYFLMNKMHRDNISKEEFRLLKANLAAQEKLVIEARTRYSEIKTLRHDMKHSLSIIGELISDGNTEKAESYIEGIISQKITPTVAGVDTGSAVVDAVINDCLARCAAMGITTKCFIDTQFVSENDVDVSILLSNLLDNAIAGCKGVEHPIIEITMKTKKALTEISVSNSISESVLDKNPELETSSNDKSIHGFGIKSVKSIVASHNGRIDLMEKNGKFIAEIWVYL